MPARIGRNWISQTSPVETHGGAATLENRPVAARKTKRSFCMWHGSRTLGHLSQINKILCFYRNLFVDVSSSFICYSKKLEATSHPSAGEETRCAPGLGPGQGIPASRAVRGSRCIFLKREDFKYGKQISDHRSLGCAWVAVGRGWAQLQKGDARGPRGDGSVLEPHGGGRVHPQTWRGRAQLNPRGEWRP